MSEYQTTRPNGSQFVAYVLTHTQSGKVYVGSTSNLQRRIWEHQGKLKRGTHHNSELQKLYDASNEIEFNSFPALDNVTVLELERDIISEYAVMGNVLNVISDPVNPSVTNPPLIQYRDSIAKRVSIDGIEYTSIKQAAKTLSYSKQKIQYWLKSVSTAHENVFYVGSPKEISVTGRVNLSELARANGLSVSTVTARKRTGVSADELFLPVVDSTVKKLSDYLGLNYSKIWYQLNTKGLSPNEIIQKYLSESNMTKENVQFVIGTDIFKQDGDLYIITVNCVGVMGAGLAKSFKEAHPDLYERYRHDCRMKIITIGNPVIYTADNGKHYMMFPTKDRWQDPSLPEYISSGLQWMVDSVGEEGDIDPAWKIVIPPLGCANGGLSFADVKENIKLFAGHMPNEVVVVYPPWMETTNAWD